MDDNIINLLCLICFTGFIGIISVITSKSKTDNDFLIASKELGIISSGFSIGASKASGAMVVIVSSLALTFGFQVFWMLAGYILGMICYYFFMLSIYDEAKKKNYYSLGDYFKDNYSRQTGLIVSIICILDMIGTCSINFVAGAKLITMVSGVTFSSSLIIMFLLITPYVSAKGFKSVVKTDIIQYSAIILIFFMIIFFLYRVDNSFSIQDIPNDKELPIGKIISFFLIGLLLPFGSPEMWQRVFATKSKKAFSGSIIISSIGFVVISCLVMFISLEVSKYGVDKNNMEIGLILGIDKLLGEGARILWIIAFSSIIISSADTFLFTAASSLVTDILPIEISKKTTKIIKKLKISIVSCSLLCVLISLWVGDALSITYISTGMAMSLGVISLISWIKHIKIPPTLISVSVCFSLFFSLVYATFFGLTINVSIVNLTVTILTLIFGTLAYKLKYVKIKISQKKKGKN